MLALTFIAVFLAICLATYALVGSAEEKATIRESLRQLGGYEIENERDRELLNPLRERAVAPVAHWFTDIGRRFTPQGYVDGIRRKLTLAGQFSPDTLDRFLAMRVVTLALIPVWLLVAFVLLGSLGGGSKLAIFALLTLGSILGPDAILNRRVAERQHEIQVRLPDVLDLLTISVEAGLGFEQALDRTVAAVPGPLSDEFARMLGEVRAGASRSDAMRAMDERMDVPEVRSFVLAILQADTFGVSIGRVLRAQADEMRIKRRQLAQEQALKAPVKMLFPMVFCIFPALFVVVIGPAVINISKNFK
ncbi:MAG: type II secretion system F family protein [Acidimicrobiia bacterium]|nr:type II secretion system F family protein [Acidimicrobiia bacterium]